MFYVYIIHSLKSDRYYKGITEDLAERTGRHNSGHVPSTAGEIPWELVWYCKKANWSEAVKLERKLKNLSRERLLKFIEKYPTGPSPDEA